MIEIKQNYIIFDFDGTLVDSMWIWEDLDIKLLAMYGKQPDEYMKEQVKTMNIEESSRFIVDYFKINETPENITKQICKLAQYEYEFNVKLKDNVHNILEKYYEDGKKMCIATVSARTYVDKFIKSNNLSKYFEFIITSEDVTAGKQKPDIYYLCTNKFNKNPQEVAVFEDALYAVKTAKAAGFYTIAVKDIVHSKDDKGIEKIADVVIDGFT